MTKIDVLDEAEAARRRDIENLCTAAGRPEFVESFIGRGLSLRQALGELRLFGRRRHGSHEVEAV